MSDNFLIPSFPDRSPVLGSGVVLHFGDPEGEWKAAQTDVVVADVSDRGRVEVAGTDRVKFLNNLSTNDITKIAVGGGAEAFFLDARGRILDFVRLFAVPDSFWVDVEPGRSSLFVRHLDKYLIREKVNLFDRSPITGQIHLAGPKASELIATTTETEVPPLQNLQHMARTIAGHDCQVRCDARSLYGGFDIVAARDDMDAIVHAIALAGASLGLRAIGAKLLNAMRIEAGLPVYGVDFSDANLPQEMGRTAEAISFTKGCYIGQETVARIDSYGHVNRLLRGVALDQFVELTLPAAVEAGDKEVGQLTSACFSPAAHATIGLAVLRTANNEPGTKVVIQGPSGPVPGTIVSLPFPKPNEP